MLAATLTVFGGAYDLSAGRLWVNSLFMAGHEAYPLYPRDVVFALLPFALLAFFKALVARGWRPAVGWALVAGGLFGVCSLVQVQLLLPIPVALVVVALVVAVRIPGRRWQALGVLVLTGGLAVALFAPWFLGQLEDDPAQRRRRARVGGHARRRPVRAVELPARVRAAPAARDRRFGRRAAVPAAERRTAARRSGPRTLAPDARRGAGRARRLVRPSRSRSASCTSPTGRSRTPSGRSGCGCSPASR